MARVSKAKLVLGILQRNQGRWIHCRTLNNICFRYGARIFDLRQQGHDIEKQKQRGVWYYRLKPKGGDASGLNKDSGHLRIVPSHI